MAILISGKSLCPLCGQIINSSSEAVATPAFLRKMHPLSKFSDAAFHRRCFEKCPQREEVERLLARFKTVMAGAPRTNNLAEHELWVKNAILEFE